MNEDDGIIIPLLTDFEGRKLVLMFVFILYISKSVRSVPKGDTTNWTTLMGWT